jgi:putative SOS response-associated peptidase YedK
MCGRYTLTRPGDILDEVWEALGETALAPAARPPGSEPPPRYNTAPTQTSPVVVRGGERAELALARWGLPARKGEAKALINARLETASSLATFAEAFVERRCLVPADGFYEWSRASGQPHWFTLPGHAGFCFAGLWQPGVWDPAPSPRGASSSKLERAFCILTTKARPPVEEVHGRMPMILAPSTYGLWLAQGELGAHDLEELAATREQLVLERRPVSPRVNRVEIDEPSLLDPSAPAPENLSLF